MTSPALCKEPDDDQTTDPVSVRPVSVTSPEQTADCCGVQSMSVAGQSMSVAGQSMSVAGQSMSLATSAQTLPSVPIPWKEMEEAPAPDILTAEGVQTEIPAVTPATTDQAEGECYVQMRI